MTADYGIPIGIELGDEKLTPSREINLDLPETTVKEFLNSVIAKDRRYTWKLEGGVIHFRPLTGRAAFLTTLLNTKISHFAFIESARRFAIFNDILKVSEIQTQLIVADVAPMIFVNFGSMHRVEKGIPFEGVESHIERAIRQNDIKNRHKTVGITALGRKRRIHYLRS